MQLTKRRLTDLWVVGREITLDDGAGEAITVWLQKLSPVEAAEASRRCNASRARMLACRHDHDSDEFQAMRSLVLDYDTDRIIEYLLMQDRLKAVHRFEAQLANEEEWSTDDYLQGLRDAWRDGLEKEYAVDPEGVEAKRVFGELKRFTDVVTESVDHELAGLAAALASQPLAQLQDDLCSRFMEHDGNQVWMEELYRCQIFYGTRYPEAHKLRYFESRAEVDELSTGVFSQLRDAYERLEVDPAEGKDSPATQPSSDSSGPPDAVVVPISSGQLAAR